MNYRRLKLQLFSLLSAIALFAVISCEIGLGQAVDTEVPEISVETPAVGAIIRDSFTISGSWSDDGSIKEVSLILKDTGNNTKYGSYKAKFQTTKGLTGKGTWNILIDKALVPDGTYEAIITITDEAEHKTETQRQIVIDNTAPVLVMQRPSSKVDATSKIDSYGRIFNLDGQAADDNGIGQLEVNVYSDPELQTLLRTISFTNIPNTITLDVAKFVEGVSNDYSAIYGSTSYMDGQRTLYCKIIAYDGTQRYPADGSAQTEEDKKGNPTSEYYLYDEISKEILSDHKITELYSMKSGRYAAANSNRSVVDSILSTLNSHKIEANKFTLNPRNNPIFSIAGFSEMAPDGNFEAANMTVSSGDFLTIQVEPGLDGHLLIKDSLKVKVKDIDVANASYIYPSEQTLSKDGDKYRIIAFMKKEDGLVSTHKYTLEVEGHDEEGNAVTTQRGIGYGFFFRRSTLAPSLSVTVPDREDEIVLNNNDDHITISGTVNFPADICNGGKVIIKEGSGTNEVRWIAGDFTNTDSTTYTDQNLTWSYEIHLKKTDPQPATGDQYLADGQHQLEIFAEYYELDDMTTPKASAIVLRAYNIDTQKPNTPVLISVNPAPSADGWCTSQNLSVTLTSSTTIDPKRDNYASGPEKTEYQIVASGANPTDDDWQQLSGIDSGFINGLQNGINCIYFRCTDSAGNVSDLASTPTELKIDGYPPEINKVWLGSGDFEVANNWLELSTEQQKTVGKTYGEKLRIEITEDNELHPTDFVTVTVKIGNTTRTVSGSKVRNDSGKWIWTSSGNIANSNSEDDTDKTIEITVKAKDEAGGESAEKKFKYLIDTQAPVIRITQPGEDSSGEKSISSPQTDLRAAINDANGTIKLSKYKLTSTPIDGTDSTDESAVSQAILADYALDNTVFNGWLTSPESGTITYHLEINDDTGATGNITDGEIKEGQWYFYVYSIDDAGNADAKKREFWTDRYPPELIVTPSTKPETNYNKASLGTDPLKAITVSGTATDANDVTSVVYSKNGGSTWSSNIYNESTHEWSFTEYYGTEASATIDGATVNRTLPDGTYTFVIKATDRAGKQTLSSNFPVRIDCEPPLINPDITISNTAVNGWYKSKTLIPTVTVTDNTSAAGNISVAYSLSEDFTGANLLANKGNGECIGGVSFNSDGADKVIYFKATDEAGNSSTAQKTGIKIDTGAPAVQEKYYQISSGSILDNISDTLYVNGSDTLTIWGSYSDTGSGVEPLQTISVSGSEIYNISETEPAVEITYLTSELPAAISESNPLPADFEPYATANAASIKSWKAVIPSSKLQSGNITAGGKDRAGNSSYTQRPTITLIKDTEAPKVSNVSVSEPSTSSTRVYQAGETTTYYLNNSSGKTFTIKGVATDNVQVSSTIITISDGTNTQTKTASDSSNWTVVFDKLYEFTGNSAAVTIESTDVAGNKSTVAGNENCIQTLTFIFDKTAPAFKHGIDAKGKDVNFRIGEYENDAHETDVGGKYQAGTYGTATSIIVRGSTDEAGTSEAAAKSGLYRVYYKILPEAPAGATPAFTKAEANGYIEASTLAAKNVDYSKNELDANGKNKKGIIEVTSTFKGEISGLTERSNYLLLLAEDNVGNTAMDLMVPTNPSVSTDPDYLTGVTLSADIITKWNSNTKYYSLNVDTKAPEIDSTTEGTLFSNGKNEAAGGKNITITGTCYDTDTDSINGHGSDISDDASDKAVTVSVNIGGTTKTVTATVNKSTTPYTWSATIPASDLTGLDVSTIPEGKTFNVDASVKDNAGLTTSSTVAILQKDTLPPTASLTRISNSVERSSGTSSLYYIRPTKDDVAVTGNTDDTYSTTVKTYLKLLPYTITGTGVSATETNADAGLKYLGSNGVKDEIEAVSPAVDRTWTLTIPKETFTLSYAGVKIYVCTEDLAGNKNEALLAKLIFDEAGPSFNAAYSVGGRTAASLEEAVNLWHRNTNLSLKGYWTDAAGTDKVYYKLLQTNYNVEANPPEYTFDNSDNSWKTFVGSEGADGIYNFENTIDNFSNGLNYVYMYAEDKLGNPVSQLSKLTIKVDTNTPETSDGYEDSEGKKYEFTNIYTTNGDADKTLYYYIDDNPQNENVLVSGIKGALNDQGVFIPQGVTVKLGGTPLAAEKYSISLSDTAGSDTKKLVTVTLDKSVLTGDGHRAVAVTLQDYAGNFADTTVGTINMDTTPPTVRLNALKDADAETAGTQVNGTITITGTAADTYLKARPLTAFQYSADGGTTWTDLYTDLSAANTNITNAADFSVKINTTAAPFADGSTYKIKAQVTDEAGNETWSTPVEFKVDQDTDRPVIKFTNLELPETTGTTESKADISLSATTLKGTVVDDDDLFETNGFQISLDGGNNFTSIPVTSDAWTYPFESDGKYEIVFKVKDGSGTEFITKATTTAEALKTTPKLTDGTNKLGTHTAGSHTEFSLMVDNKLPLTQNLKYKLVSEADTAWASTLPKLGGPSDRETNNKFMLQLIAGDENGIVSVKGKLDGTAITDAELKGAETNDTLQERPVKKSLWQFDLINVSSLSAGSHSIELTIEDGAGNEKQETVTLSIDKTAPEIDITSPTADSTESASVWAYGTISGAKDKGLKYAISTHGDNAHKPDGQTEITSWEEYISSTSTSPTAITSTYKPAYSADMDFGITWNIYFDNDLSSTTDTHAKLLNQYLIDMGITTEAALKAKDSTQFNKLVKLYLWMRAEDEVGNVAEKSFPIILDPQGSRPKVNFTYPAEKGAMLGGKVTIYGTAEDTKGDNPGVDSVWVQLISGTHWNSDNSEDTSSGYGSFTSSATYDITSFNLTKKDLDYLRAKGYSVYNMNDGSEYHGTITSGTANDYAVKANLSGSAWLLDINENKEFNPTCVDDEHLIGPLAIRVYARDNDNNFSLKLDRLVRFDANKPVIGNLKLVQYKDAENLDFTITASQAYSNEVYVKGDWWLTGTVSDGDKIGSLSINGSALVEKEDNVITPVTNKAWWASEHDTIKDVVEFRYKLGTGTTDSVGKKTVDIVAYDDADGEPNKGEETITVKYDNKAPVIAGADTGREISSKVQQYNGFYKFSSKATEADVAGEKQSGYAYTAFYFKRSYGTTTKLYDVLQPRASAMHNISGQTISVLGSEGAVSDNTRVTKDGLYWFVKNIHETDDTMAITECETTNIHKNSLVSIGGAYYLVKAVTGTTVTLDRNVPAGFTKAYVALAGIVDNSNESHTDGAKPQWPENGYYADGDLIRDDGDFMVEDVSKQDTTWTWEANICSRNIPDGPIEICYVVFDKAGNFTSDSVSGFVGNNQPRIAGVTIKTDYTGNNEAETVVSEYIASELSEDSVTGSIGTSPNTKQVYDPFANSLTKNDEYPLSQTMTAGSAARPVLKVRGLTQIIPEIVGGNGSVHYSYDVTNGTKTLSGTNTTTALYSETDTEHPLNYDYTINESAPINLQVGDLVYLGDTTTGIPFKFTFKDDTEGISTYSADEKSAWETQLGVKFEAELEVYLAINACQETWPTASIKPFYWNSLTDNSIYDSKNATSVRDLKGHIELEADWANASGYDGNASGTYLDADPKVSGEIVLKGTAFDAKLLNKIEITLNNKTKTVAEYNSTTGSLESKFLESDYAAKGLCFKIDKQTSNSDGHTVNWTLVWNTQNTQNTSVLTKPANPAQKDVVVTVKATNAGVPKRTVDATNGTLVSVDGTTKYLANQFEKVNSNTVGTTQTTSTTNTAFYRMDVVPYVTDVQTSLSSTNASNHTVYSRTALGHYPVYMTRATGAGAYTYEENIKVYGFNLAGGALSFDSGDNGSNSINLTAASGYYTFKLPAGARSGKATITVGTEDNAVQTLNNKNYDDSNGSSNQTVEEEADEAKIYGTYFYNRQPNDENNNLLTDDLYFDVWDFNSQAAQSYDNSTLDVMMKINPYNGLIGFAFCNGVKRWSMAGRNNSYQVFTTSAEFVQCTSFGYSVDGNTYGAAAGGESDVGKADAYIFMTSRWNSLTKYTGQDDNNSLRMESTCQKNGTDEDLDKKRFLSPSYATLKVNGTNNENIYLAYFDGITNEIRFRAGTLDTTKTNKTGLSKVIQKGKDNKDYNVYYFGNFKDRYSGWVYTNGVYPMEYDFTKDDCQVVANSTGTGTLGKAGEYVSIGVTSNNIVVMVWYDNEDLKFSYNTNPLALTTGTNSTNWSDAETLISGAGQYCQLVVDSADNIHVAAFDKSNGDLKYAYIPFDEENEIPNYEGKKVCTVDSYQVVGKELTIDVAKEGNYYIPHIGYLGTTPKKPRYAYLSNPALFAAGELDGVNKDTDIYTGVWECGIVPTNSTITLHEKRRINIGVWKKSNGERRNSYYTADGPDTEGESKDGSSTAGKSEGTCYGNGTENAVLAYGVKYSSTRDFVETAQMR